MRVLPVLLVLPLVLSGCIAMADSVAPAGAGSEADAAAWDAVRALMADVPCEAEVGAGTSANVLPLGALAFEEGAVGEMDVRGDLALVARYQAGGLYVVSLADPRAPALLGTLPLDGTEALDVKWLPDGSGAVVAAYKKLFVVDLADPASPVVAAEAVVPTQAHMVTAADLGGKTYLYVASQTTNYPAFVYEMDGWTPRAVGSFGLGAGPVQSLALGNHDVTILNDTLLGKPTLYLADGLAGWSAWSLDDPARPQRLGGSLGQELGAGYVHTVRVGFFGETRVVVTMQEVGQNTLKIYDATDLQAPVLLARWNADATRPHIPQHNIQLLGDWLFMAHYTEGVYVFNLSAVVASPPLLGTLALEPAAHWAIESPDDGGALGFANVWDVSVNKGVLYASGLDGSLTSLGFGCLTPGDEAATATA